jgi:hypothetical protein
MIPLWLHLSVVLALLAACGTQHIFYRRGIESLRLALVAKDVLLGDADGESWAWIGAKQTMTLKTERPFRRVSIRSLHGTRLQVTFDDA